MKKLLLLGLLTVAATAGFVQESRAWGLRDHCCCQRCTTTITIRPYNAFTPICCGNICCNGSCPSFCCGDCGGCGPQCAAPPSPCMPSCFMPSFGEGCCTSGCCESGCLPAPGSFANVPPQMSPGQPMPQGQPGQKFTPPMPQPMGQSTYMGYGYAPVQPVNYMPAYQPTFNPYTYPSYGYGYAGQVPTYWYGQ